MDRNTRRRLARADRKSVAGGLDSDPVEARQIAMLMRVLHNLVEELRDAGSVAPLMTWFAANMEAAGRKAPRRVLACRRHCAFCCHAWVSARAPEILFALGAVPARGREPVAAAIAAADAITGGLDPEARSRRPIACPLLDRDLCRVYAARPATCRTAVSTDVRPCERAFRTGEAVGIPTPDAYFELRAGYSLALAGALRRAGFPAAAYEFNSGLAAALARPDAEAAWLSGEDVFACALKDPVGDPFDRPANRRLYDSAWAD